MLKYEKVNTENLQIAVNIQGVIFPKEPFPKEIEEYACGKNHKICNFIEFYLVKDDGEYVGLTGLYSYKEYPKDVFLNWFGVLPAYRNKGLGEKIFKWTLLRAKKNGYKYFRLYTEKGDNDKAINLYRKMRMHEEIYNKEKGINNMIVFSKLLKGKKLRIWNNRFLGIFPAHIFYSDHPIKTILTYPLTFLFILLIKPKVIYNILK